MLRCKTITTATLNNSTNTAAELAIAATSAGPTRMPSRSRVWVGAQRGLDVISADLADRVFRHVSGEIRPCFLQVKRRAGHRDDDQGDELAPYGVRGADDDGFGDGRVSQDGLFEFDRIDVLASGDDRVLAAADGIHSAIRQQLIGQLPARDSGLCAWRAMIPSDRLPERFVCPTQTLWLGPGRHLVHYPVSAGRTVNVVAFTPAAPGETVESWSAEGRPEDFRAEFAGWDGMVGHSSTR